MKESSTVRVTVAGGKASAMFLGILFGALIGIGLSVAFGGFDPSQEYLDEMIALDSLMAATTDSLDTIREAKLEADSTAAALLDHRDVLTDELEAARFSADAHRRRADSLHAANAGSDDPDVLHAEIDALRGALSAREAECADCAAVVAEGDSIIAEQQREIALRDEEIRLLSNEVSALQHAVDLANAEIERAAGRISLPEWWHPTITAGAGCTWKLDCGPAVVVGFSFSPF